MFLIVSEERGGGCVGVAVFVCVCVHECVVVREFVLVCLFAGGLCAFLSVCFVCVFECVFGVLFACVFKLFSSQFMFLSLSPSPRLSLNTLLCLPELCLNTSWLPERCLIDSVSCLNFASSSPTKKQPPTQTVASCPNAVHKFTGSATTCPDTTDTDRKMERERQDDRETGKQSETETETMPRRTRKTTDRPHQQHL